MPLSFPYIYKNVGPVKIATWADGTPTQIAAMLQAHDDGLINIYDYWSVGDKRTVHLNAIPANSSGSFTTAMPEQDVVMVLMNEGYNEQSGIHFVVGQENSLNKAQRVSSSTSNTGSWGSCSLRADLNNLYYNAFADADFKALFKDFSVVTTETPSGTALQTVTDKFAVFAEKEIFGVGNYCNSTEAAALSQIKYYETAANRIKSIDGTASYWWERSPCRYNAKQYCFVKENGEPHYNTYSTSSLGIAPFGCI